MEFFAYFYFVSASFLPQTEREAITPVLLEGGNFFISIIAGVLLAIAFQLILTAVSVAGGITAVGNIRKTGKDQRSESSEDDHGMNIGQKISTGLGAWTMITTSISLFFASWLAVQLGLVGADFIGATLGLVIWATFFILMTYLEVNAVSSLIGGMVSTVRNSISSVFSSFSKSDANISKEVAKTGAQAQAKEMRKQFENLFQTHDIDQKVEDYVKKLKPQRVDINNLKNQIKDLITDLQVTEKAEFDYPNSAKKMILEEADKSTLSKEDKEAIKDHVTSLKDIAQQDASDQEKVKQGIENLTQADRKQIDDYQAKIKEALRSTKKREFQPERLEEDLKRILNEPGQVNDVIKSKASAMDRDALVKIIASQNMEEREAEKYLDKVEGVLRKVQAYFGEKSSQASAGKNNLQTQIKNLFSGGAAIDMDQIYSDFTSMFQGSAQGSDLKYKLKHYNKEEMTSLITRKTPMDRSEAEPVADNIVSARDKVVENAHRVEDKVNQEMDRVKEKSLAAAEESRKAAMTAAWWLVGTAILSGVASAVGGMLALGS